MSQENVEVVRSLLPGPDVDMTETLRNDDVWAASVPASSALIHPDFECVGTLFGSETIYAGMDGFRQFLLDWLTPWESYRAEVEQTIDAGEQVVTVYRIFGRRSGHVHEVSGRAAWVWSVCDGKVARIKGYNDPTEALKAVGLE